VLPPQWTFGIVFEVLFPYIKIFGMLFGSAFGLPIPEDLALIIAGFWISSGHSDAVAMVLVCYLGVLTGDLIIFRAGRMAGPAIFRRRWIRSRLKSKRLRKLRKGLSERAFLTVLVARHVFYLRTVTFLLCGAVRMPFARFLFADAVAALVTVPLVVGLGYLFGDYQNELLMMVKQAKYTLGTMAFFVGTYVVVRYLTKRRKSVKQKRV
jgi:membrane protein DedA with SNARE-associated domain